MVATPATGTSVVEGAVMASAALVAGELRHQVPADHNSSAYLAPNFPSVFAPWSLAVDPVPFYMVQLAVQDQVDIQKSRLILGDGHCDTAVGDHLPVKPVFVSHMMSVVLVPHSVGYTRADSPDSSSQAFVRKRKKRRRKKGKNCNYDLNYEFFKAFLSLYYIFFSRNNNKK